MPERQVITTLSGVVAPLLTVSTSQVANVDRHSIWLPREWKKTTPFVIDDITISPNNPQALSVEMIYDLSKQAHLIKSMVMRIVIPPHTVVPAGTASLVDFIGYAVHDYFRTHFGSNLCYETLPHDLYFRHRKLLKTEQVNCENEEIGGDLSLAQRTNDLANGREYFVKLYQPFEEHQSTALPLLTLSQKTRFVHKTRALTNLIVAAPGTTVTANGQYTFELIMKQVNLTGNEAAVILNMSKNDQGIAYMIHQHVRQNSDDIASTQNGFQASIRMTAFTKPMKKIYWALIPTKLINDTGRNDIFFFAATPTLGPVPPGMTAYNPIQSYEIVANGQQIQRRILRNYDRLHNHFLYSPAPHGEEIFNQIYNEYPGSFSAAIGYLDYTNFNNPVLNITFGTGGTGTDPDVPANAQSLRVLLNGEDYNFWYFQNGNFVRSFN